MRISYVIDRIRPTGGVKVVGQHVRLLRERGYEAHIFTLSDEDRDYFGIEAERVEGFDPRHLPPTDIVVATTTGDVKRIYRLADHGIKICHLVQGLEVADLEARIRGDIVPPRYRDARWRYLFKRLSYINKKRRLENIYRLRTHKIAVSKGIQQEIERRYHQRCYLVPNGIDRRVFYPSGKPDFSAKNIRLVSVGPYNVTAKGIPDLLSAVSILKARGIGVSLTRVSYTPQTDIEKDSGLVDEYRMCLSGAEMAELYRSSHILVAPSLEGEGFGLPVIEAMGCGLPCVLTETSAYLSLDTIHDYACFVPMRSPEAIADAIVRIIEDEGFREGLIKGGLRVAQIYSLERTGECLVETFEDILKRGG